MRHLFVELFAIGLIAAVTSRYAAGDKAGATYSVTIPIPGVNSAQKFTDGRYSGSIVRTSDTQAMLVYEKSGKTLGYVWVGVIAFLVGAERVRRYRAEMKKNSLSSSLD